MAPKICLFLQKKIELIHRCCEIGNVEELRKYLDRRKLSVARESKSDLFLTPLHVAVAFNRIEVARHLGGRFPETLHQQDKLGRTPLHYAAMRADGKFAYNTLLTLGANKDLEDHVSITSYVLNIICFLSYYSKPNFFTIRLSQGH